MMVKHHRRKTSKTAYTTETKLADDAPASSCCGTAVFYCCWSGVTAESIELELGLIADLGGKGLIAGNIEIGPAKNFVRSHPLARCNIAQDLYFRHG